MSMTKRKASYKRSSSKNRKDTSVEDIPEIVTRNTMDRTFKTFKVYIDRCTQEFC